MTKLCECGCGEPTTLSKLTNKRLGLKKGQPNRFINQHATRRPSTDKALKEGWFKPNEKEGYCYCGCGEKTSISTYTNKKSGSLIGQHQRFIKGHNVGGPGISKEQHRIWASIGGKAPKPSRKKRFCLNEHDTHQYGRNSSGACIICDQNKKRKFHLNRVIRELDTKANEIINLYPELRRFYYAEEE